MSYQHVNTGPRSTRFPFHGLDGCAPCMLGRDDMRPSLRSLLSRAFTRPYGPQPEPPTAPRLLMGLGQDMTVSPVPAGRIVSGPAYTAAYAHDRTASYLWNEMRRRGFRYDADAYRRALARATSSSGSVTLSRNELGQLVMGTAVEMKRLVERLYLVAMSPDERARRAEPYLISAVNNLATSAQGLGRSIAPASGGASGLGQDWTSWVLPIIFGPSAFFVIAASALAQLGRSTMDANEAARLFDSVCGEGGAQCRREAYREWLEHQERLRAADQNSIWGPVAGAVGTVVKVVGITAAVGLAGYLVFTFWPHLFGFAKRMRERGRARFARNPRRRRRRAKKNPRRRLRRNRWWTGVTPLAMAQKLVREEGRAGALATAREEYAAEPGPYWGEVEDAIVRGVAKNPAKPSTIAAIKRAADVSAPSRLPAGARERIVELGPGMYRVAADGVVTRFRVGAWGRQMDNVRMAARWSGDVHYWVDARDPDHPVVLRKYDGKGQAVYRVEEAA